MNFLRLFSLTKLRMKALTRNKQAFSLKAVFSSFPGERGREVGMRGVNPIENFDNAINFFLPLFLP